MSDVVVVTSQAEIARVLRAAVADHAEVHCETPNGRTVPLEIRSLSGMSLVLSLKRDASGSIPLLSSVFQEDLAADFELEVVISLVDGQYAIRERVSDVSLSTFTISASRSILKLQRRSDFRVSVRAEGYVVALTIRDTTLGEKQHELTILDLSAGGMRVLWPTSTLGMTPRRNQSWEAELKLSPPAVRGTVDEKTATVTMECVRDHGPENPERPQDGHAVSFRFHELQQDEARTILFVCLSVHRARYALR